MFSSSFTRCLIQVPLPQFSYENGDKSLVLEPLKGQIDPSASSFTIGKIKVEIRLAKLNPGRWGGLVGDSPDRKHPANV
jgi:suppressor of G2 allele of SKP1